LKQKHKKGYLLNPRFKPRDPAFLAYLCSVSVIFVIIPILEEKLGSNFVGVSEALLFAVIFLLFCWPAGISLRDWKLARKYSKEAEKQEK
jgi:hypothetical protein